MWQLLLVVSIAGIGAAGIAHLNRRHAVLQSLKFASPNIAYPFPLWRMPSIAEISGPHITKEKVSAVARIHTVDHFAFNSGVIDDEEVLESIIELGDRVKYLTFRNVELSDTAAIGLSRLSGVRRIAFAKCNLNSHIFEQLAKCKSLEHIIVQGGPVSSQIVDELSECRHLKYFVTVNVPLDAGTQIALDALASSHPELTIVNDDVERTAVSSENSAEPLVQKKSRNP
jgi:hypothetical protein